MIIQSDDEHKFAESVRKGWSESAWIGLENRGPNDKFRWVNGLFVDKEVERPEQYGGEWSDVGNQPDNRYNLEDCAEFNFASLNGWNDLQCSFFLRSYVCEKSKLWSNYVFRGFPGFTDALVVMKTNVNAAEQEKITGLFQSRFLLGIHC